MVSVFSYTNKTERAFWSTPSIEMVRCVAQVF